VPEHAVWYVARLVAFLAKICTDIQYLSVLNKKKKPVAVLD
jgi:hypothetical protein